MRSLVTTCALPNSGSLYFPFSLSLVRCMRPICESVAFTCSAQLLACRGDDPQSPNQIHSLVKEQPLSNAQALFKEQ